VLQCVALCCSALQCVAVCFKLLKQRHDLPYCLASQHIVLQHIVLQCSAMCVAAQWLKHIVLQRPCCSTLYCSAQQIVLQHIVLQQSAHSCWLHNCVAGNSLTRNFWKKLNTIRVYLLKSRVYLHMSRIYLRCSTLVHAHAHTDVGKIAEKRIRALRNGNK